MNANITRSQTRNANTSGEANAAISGHLSLYVPSLLRPLFCFSCSLLMMASSLRAGPPRAGAAADFSRNIQPILSERCYDCHGDGEKKGGVVLDAPVGSLVQDHELWSKVLKNVRAGLMPPAKKTRLAEDEKKHLADWVKYQAFGIDPKAPDPGRPTLRRLNRAEYRNTIRDLMGVDFRADEEFPADDSGHGFDNIGDVLSVSPMLLEKYMNAASQIVSEAVPDTPRVPAEHLLLGRQFVRSLPTDLPTTKPADAPTTKPAGADAPTTRPSITGDHFSLSYYEPATVNGTIALEHAGHYTLILEMVVKGKYAERGFDYNKCEVTFEADGVELLRQQYGWDQKKELRFEFPEKWEAGEHQFSISLKPITHDLPHYGELEMQLSAVRVRGPVEKQYWVRPKNYERFFGQGDEGATDPARRKVIAQKILSDFASRAMRRPVDEATVTRLVGLAESVYGDGQKSFEAGIRHAMVAVLASPRFLFIEEASDPADKDQRYPRVDQYTLASRLSYFLWSSLPDQELTSLAAAGKLREQLQAQISRMLADPRSDAFIQNFTGQWLQARDVETVALQDFRITDRATLRKARLLTDRDKAETRNALRQEIEQYFAYVVREDRPVLELIDSNYTFANERLANYYGIPGVTGSEMRKITLPEGNPRGGVLTMGGILRVTSNPTRTSPVKRGLFLLENVIGAPPPPPPADIPPLEDAGRKITDHHPTLRQTLELHRASPLCASCHDRMDPLGLAFENFNALGLWRESDANQPINAAGKLITGESFHDVRELKHTLATDRKQDFYRCLTEKLLTYSLGRGLEYYDVETVDQIIERMERNDGRFSALLSGIIESAPFQRERSVQEVTQEASAQVNGQVKN